MLSFTLSSTYVFISPQMLHLPEVVGYPLGIACLVVAIVWFTVWYKRHSNSMRNE